MKKRFLKYILLLAGMLMYYHSVYSQWSFEYGEGPCSLNAPNGAWGWGYSFSGFNTRQECEAKRQSLHRQPVRTALGTPMCWICGECTGTDVILPQQPNQNSNQLSGTTGNLNFNGPQQGTSFYSTNQGSEISDWIDDANFLQQALRPGTRSVIPTPKTGNGQFDDVYSVLVFDSKNGNRRELRRRPNTSNPYIRQSGYNVMRELAEKAGLNFSNYFSEAEWNIDVAKASTEDLIKWHAKYNQFINDVYGSDQFALPREAMNAAIDGAADAATSFMEFSKVGIIATAEIRAGAQVLKAANNGMYGGKTSVSGMVVNAFEKTRGDIKAGIIGAGISEAFGFASSKVTNYLEQQTSAGGLATKMDNALAQQTSKIKTPKSNIIKSTSNSIKRGRLGTSNGKIIRGKSITSNSVSPIRQTAEYKGPRNIIVESGRFTDKQVSDLAHWATRSPNEQKIMLGRYQSNNVSYIGEGWDGYCFFNSSEYDNLMKQGVSNDEFFRINKKFIDNQFHSGKEFYFSHDPKTANGYFKMELDHLKELTGKKNWNFQNDFEQIGELWKLKR